MGILRADRVTGLGGANAITGSTFFGNGNGTAGNYLRIDTGTPAVDFAFATGDFTIEFWFNRIAHSSQQHFYDFRGTTNTNTLLIYMVNNVIYYFGNGSERITSGTVPSDKWVHFALVRSSGSTKMYFDGVQTGSTFSDSINFVGPDKGSGFIGSNGGTDGINPSGSYLSAYLSNFRVQKGKAEYTAAFTPPTHRLEKTPETVLLTCNSPGNVSNEETGKVVTPERDTLNDAFALASRFTPHSPSTFTQYVDQGTNFGSTFDGVTTFDSQAYFVPPGGITRDRYPKSTGDIVSGNLIFHLDGGDSKSYAGVTTSGSIIYDLKEGTNSTGVGIATMASGHSDFERVTWVPDNRGCFRQSSDSNFGTITGNRIEFPQISLGNDNYTINVWVKLNSVADGGDEIMSIIGNKDGGPVSFAGHLRMNNGFARIGAQAYYSSWTYRYSTTTAIGTGKWHLLTWVNTAQYTGKMYVDGVLQTFDDGNTTWNSRTSNNTPLNSTAYAGGETFDGWIGQIQLYSDTLSETEILQNYNAHKCRYIY